MAAEQVPWFVWLIVVGVDVALVAALVAAVRRYGGPGASRRAAFVAAVLAAWFVLAFVASWAGLFVATPGGPPTIALGVFPPIVAGALALAFSPRARALALAIPQPWLVGVQTLRVVGAVFLVLLGRGLLPAQFAVPAGWGDVAVGVAAPFVAGALARRKPWSAPLAVAWNALGLVDLAVAVGVGAFSAQSAARVFTSGPPTDAMAQLPLSLIPAFGVPLFVLLHVVSLLGLRKREERGARRTPPGVRVHDGAGHAPA
jgi:hypothetical protein